MTFLLILFRSITAAKKYRVQYGARITEPMSIYAALYTAGSLGGIIVS